MGEPGAGEINNEIIFGPPIEPPNTFGENDILDIKEQVIAAERIKNRDAMDIRNNFERSMKGINDFYVEKQIQSLPKRFKLIPRPVLKKYFSHKLERLAESFGEDFNTTVFSDIVHFSKSDLGESVELKSPILLAKESNVPFDEVPGKHSGGVDVEIGTTDYVFGASMGLPAKQTVSARVGSAEFDYHAKYKIESEDGYAVPADITVFRPHKSNPNQPDFSMYADNIFTLQDFKKLLPTYCAAIFPSPKVALEFLGRFWARPSDDWFSVNDLGLVDLEFGGSGLVGADKLKILQCMRQIFTNANVYPPFCPEFQFRDHVKATRIEQYKVDV